MRLSYAFLLAAPLLVLGCGGGGGGVAKTSTALKVRSINLLANDLIFDSSTSKFYASTPGSVGALGNSVIPIAPLTGALGTAIPVGSEPNLLALSDDGQALYVALDGAAAVRKVDVAAGTAGLQFTLGVDPFSGPLYVEDISVAPGAPDTILVAREVKNLSPAAAGVAVYDAGVARSNVTSSFPLVDTAAFGTDATLAYGYDTETTDAALTQLIVDSSGVTTGSSTSQLLSGAFKIRYLGGRIYGSSGTVVDPATFSLLGTYSGASSATAFAIDTADSRAYFVVGSKLRSYNLATFTLLSAQSIPGVTPADTILSLCSWGQGKLGFRTKLGRICFIDNAP